MTSYKYITDLMEHHNVSFYALSDAAVSLGKYVVRDLASDCVDFGENKLTGDINSVYSILRGFGPHLSIPNNADSDIEEIENTLNKLEYALSSDIKTLEDTRRMLETHLGIIETMHKASEIAIAEIRRYDNDDHK